MLPDPAANGQSAGWLSKTRAEVVPTATIRRFSRFARLSESAAAASIEKVSSCIRWSSSVSAVIGLNVPIPTCSVTMTRSIPFASRTFKSSVVKCNPAVGAG